MKKLRNLLTPRVTVCLFVVAALLLGTSAIGGTRAALQIRSDTYVAQIEMLRIGVSLQENGGGDWVTVSRRDYVQDSRDQWITEQKALLGEEWKALNGVSEKEPVKLGKTYPEALRVVNSGAIGEYVRVSVYKYWYVLDEYGQEQKLTDLDPSLIDLHFLEGNGWHISDVPGDNTAERTVLYYDPLLSTGEASEPFTDTLTIDPRVQLKIEPIGETTEGNVIKTVYKYDNVYFGIEAVVDAVQDHNASDAKLSSWGVTG